MDCNNARLLLEVAHPLATQLPADDTQALAAHLAECPECGPWAEAERRSDEKLALAMLDVPVPAGLQDRLLRRLHVERDAIYRRWAVRAAGIAAAFLLACLVGYTAWFNKRPAPDLVQFHAEVDDVPYSAERVEEAFAARGIAMTAPPKFEYGYLKSVGLANFQGRQVPYLLFLHEGAGNQRPATAQVYVLSERQFNLSDLAGLVVPGSRQSITVLRDPANPQFAYVVVHSAGTQPHHFFRPTKPTT